tara:strand:- start:6 stop:419 length:414 start_codon:yes stop_codon:yes gene_type:complete
MNNPPITDKDWDELEQGPFIYSDDSNDTEYLYECSKCNARWDESKEPKCICLDESELISFEDHEIENIPIKLDTNKMDTKYLDELILHEYGTHDINEYTEWTNDWYKWLNDEKKSDKSKIKSIVLEQKKVDSKDLNK